MALFRRFKLTQPVTTRLPSNDGVIAWVKKEIHPFLLATRRIVNWLCDNIGLAMVDSTDTPGELEDKLVDSATVVWSKGGSAGTRTLSAAATGAALDDHLVKATATDSTTVGGVYEKTLDSTSVSRVTATDGGVLKVKHALVAPTILPKPLGVAAYGTAGSPAALQDHVHPGQSLAPVVAFCGAHDMLEVDWTEGPTGTWTKNSYGSVSGSLWADYATLAANDRIFVADHTPGVTIVYDIQAGPYDILAIGGPAEYAMIRRSTDADQDAEFVAGMSVLIGTGTEHAGETWVLLNPPITVDATEQQWVKAASGGAGHTHIWSAIVPSGTARFPMPTLTIATGGKLTLEDGNFFVVNPNGNDLEMISDPVVGAYQTRPLFLLFTAPVSIVHQATPASGYCTIVSSTDGLYLPTDWSTAILIYAGGQWVVSSERSPE